MKFKKPKIFIIAKTEICAEEEINFLKEIGVEKWNTDTENSAQRLIEIAGKTCYMSFNTSINKNLTKVRQSNNKDYIKNIIDVNHGSVLEHATVTLAMTNVSRIFTHELVRHRTGTAFSQESGRYVRIDKINSYKPKCLDAEELKIFTSILSGIEEDFLQLEKQCFERLAKEGNERFYNKKQITSALRRLLPNGQSNTIIFTANHRALRHIINMRTADGAEEEIKHVMNMVKNMMIAEFPNIYQDMV